MSVLSHPRRLLLLLALATGLCGCPSITKSGQRYQKAQLQKTLSQLETVGLVIGEFPYEGPSAVLDGDTVKVKGLKSSLRLLGIDTEETFKKESERRAYAAGFEQYMKALRGNSPRPVKAATPLGEEATAWAKEFFQGVNTLRLERDHPGEIRDYYGRYLAYVMVEKNGTWMNYNVECVRAGMSPYFQKYGRSRRFHKEFLQAQDEARKAARGIWDPKKEHYSDYDERLAWWDGRGDQVHAFEEEMAKNPSFIPLTRWDAIAQLEKQVGKEVVVLGVVQEVRLGDRGPTVVTLSRNRTNNLDVIFFDKDVFKATNLAGSRGEYVQVHGTVNKYRGKRNRETLQLVVHMPSQVAPPGTAVRMGTLSPTSPVVLAPGASAPAAPAVAQEELGEVQFGTDVPLPAADTDVQFDTQDVPLPDELEPD
jgi:endonuclease YncB( thermonuclease family)